MLVNKCYPQVKEFMEQSEELMLLEQISDLNTNYDGNPATKPDEDTFFNRQWMTIKDWKITRKPKIQSSTPLLVALTRNPSLKKVTTRKPLFSRRPLIDAQDVWILEQIKPHTSKRLNQSQKIL